MSVFASAIAQQFPYQFSYTNEPYVALSNGITLNNDDVWNEGVTFPLGFSFQFGGVSYDSLILEGYSGGLFPKGDAFFNDTTDAILGYVVNTSLAPKGNTKARYFTTGTAPNRIVKVEMFRAGFDGEAGEVSYQIWLYETSNTIQIRLGTQTVPNPSNTFFNKVSPLIGFMLDYYYVNEFESVFPQAQFVVGSPTAPVDSIIVNGTLDESNQEGPLYGMTGLPLDNSVFTFTPGVVSTKQALLTALRVSPNPAQDIVRIEGMDERKAAQVQLMDQQGRVITSNELPAGETLLRLPVDLPPGLYLLRYNCGTQIAVAKLLKI